MSESMALSFSGLSRVIVATCPSTSNLIDIPSASLPAAGGAYPVMPSQDCEPVGEEAFDERLEAVVEGVDPLAAAVEHQVVDVDRRVLVAAEGAVPLDLVFGGAVHGGEIARSDRGTRHGSDPLAPPAHPRHRKAAEVDQGLTDLGDLPVEHGGDRPVAIEQQVAEVVVGVDDRGRTGLRIP